jgi:4-hydroxybenzoate polyprenyltransferase/phosphoglycolate phosphatase-like HAD superfamily hydrolase
MNDPSPAALIDSTSSRPLAIDLDGTLCRTDTLWESFLAAWRLHWWMPLAAIMWLAKGRPHFKAEVARLALPDVTSLPWSAAVLNALHEARRSGRRCVLATAADQRVARACATHLGLFDEVIASDGSTNMKGQRKADALVTRFGHRGFDYIGDSTADMPVWAEAAGKFSVSSFMPPGGSRLVDETTGSSAAAWIKLLRARHWIKNILVFVAPVAAHQWTNASSWIASTVTFVAFCCVCSAVYVINDLFDLASDRLHPSKQARPLAAGTLPLAHAALVAVLLFAVGLTIAWQAGAGVVAIIMLYVGVNAVYTLTLKRVPVFDVFCLAGLYTLRIVAGAVAVAVPLSTWLVAFSVFAFLSLALLKRAADISRLAPEEGIPGRGYRGRDAAFVNALGVSTAIASCLVLALYVASDQVASMYGEPLWLWGLVVIVLLWLARMWRIAMIGAMDDDPVLFATRDSASWACAAVVAGCIVMAL